MNGADEIQDEKPARRCHVCGKHNSSVTFDGIGHSCPTCKEWVKDMMEDDYDEEDLD